MCGITGIFNFSNSKVDSAIINLITETIAHRGPDATGIALFENVALGHRRLSIIDLSTAANQPMFSDNKKYCIVFNGEIYNFKEIKDELIATGILFHTESDTEVVLNAYIVWGHNCFKKFNGMFALAIYDNINQTVILARDSFGIKPLYYYKDNKVLVFASEMKAILAHPEVNITMNKQALTEYLWYGNPMGNLTFYNEICELSAGHYMVISKTSSTEIPYFQISDITQISVSEAEAIEQVKILLDQSVKRHLISDVPVGVFLSGGIDSSAITAIASKYYSGKINTYSVGFDFIKGPNELAKAASVAKKFGTNHHEIQISGTNVIESIEALVNAHDEPFGDAANIPLFLLTQQLKGSIKVVLQGDGGDEFFGGYSRYNTMKNRNLWKILTPISPLISISKTENTRLLRLQRFLKAIGNSSPALRNALLLTMESKHSDPLQILNNSFKSSLSECNPFMRYEEVYDNYSNEIDSLQKLFYTDSQIILKDTYFEKVDKSTMANSMEVRIPFLDKKLTEYMLSLSPELKIKNGVKKYLIKKAMEGVVPNDILYGPKTGFSVPYSYWLQTSLYSYFKEQVLNEKCKTILDSERLIKMLEQHKNGKGNFGFLLWKSLNLAIWINKYKTTL